MLGDRVWAIFTIFIFRNIYDHRTVRGQTTGLQHVDFAAYVADTISSFSIHTSYSRSTYDNPAKILQRFTKF